MKFLMGACAMWLILRIYAELSILATYRAIR